MPDPGMRTLLLIGAAALAARVICGWPFPAGARALGCQVKVRRAAPGRRVDDPE